MTLRLILMRHAKSASPQEGLLDHERPLTLEGRSSVALQAQFVRDAGWKPELLYASDARRTKETAELFVPQFQPLPTLHFVADLYQASPGEIIKFLSQQPLEAKTIQIVGHNPTMESLLEHLTSEFREFKPASIGMLEHSAANWQQALTEAGCWRLSHFL